MKNTNNKICLKVEEILLKKYNDQKLNPDEIELLQNHLKDCKSCQWEEKLFDILRYKSESDSPNYTLSGEEKRKVFEKIWERLNKNIAESNLKKSRKFALIAAAAVILISLSTLALIWLMKQKNYESKRTFNIISCVGEVLTGNENLCEKNQIGENSNISVNKGFLSFSENNGYTIYVLEDSSISIGSIKDKRRSIVVEKGYIVFRVTKGKERIPLIVETKLVRVMDTSTLFSVEVLPAQIIVRVSEGEVIVIETNGQKRNFSSGERFSIIPSGKVVDYMPPEEIRRDTNIANGKIEKQIAKTTETASIVEKTEEQAESKFVEHGEDLVAGKKQPSPSQLLKLARDFKANERWDEALKTYEKIVRIYPSSEESKVALVSIGEIFLERKNNPENAEKYFSKYMKLHPSGNLLEEAWYGMIRSYRKSGKTGMEASEIRKFIKRFPSSIYTKGLEKRLYEIEEENDEKR